MIDQLGLLSKKFSEMPLWVQVTTYLVLLALYVYLLLCPRFINGQMVAKTGRGGFIPYRGVDLQTSVEGRVLKFKTNESGFWSVPVVARLPGSIRLQVYHEDEEAWHEVKLSAGAIWKKDDFRLEIMDQEPWVRIERIARLKEGGAEGVNAVSWADKIFGQAYAAELKIPKAAAVQAAGRVDQEEVRQRVFEIIANVSQSNTPIKNDYPLSGKKGLSYVKRIKLIESIEQKMGLKIPDEHWREIATAGQLADYVYKRKALEAYNPHIYGEDKSVSWPEMNQKASPEQRPVFTK